MTAMLSDAWRESDFHFSLGWRERFRSENRAAKNANGSESRRAEWRCQRGNENQRVRTWSLDRADGIAGLACSASSTQRPRTVYCETATNEPTTDSFVWRRYATDDDCRSALHCDHTSCRCHSPPPPPPPLLLPKSHLFPFARRFPPAGNHDSCVMTDPRGLICCLIWKPATTVSYMRRQTLLLG